MIFISDPNYTIYNLKSYGHCNLVSVENVAFKTKMAKFKYRSLNTDHLNTQLKNKTDYSDQRLRESQWNCWQ